MKCNYEKGPQPEIYRGIPNNISPFGGKNVFKLFFPSGPRSPNRIAYTNNLFIFIIFFHSRLFNYLFRFSKLYYLTTITVVST